MQAQSWSKCDNFCKLDEPMTSTDKNVEAGSKKTKSKSFNVPVEEKCPGQFASSLIRDNDIVEVIKWLRLRESVAGKGNDKEEINTVDTSVEELSTTRPSLTHKFGTKKGELKGAKINVIGSREDAVRGGDKIEN